MNKIFKPDFPNLLRISRRKVVNDEAINKINESLKRIDNFRNQKSIYLANYLSEAKRIDV